MPDKKQECVIIDKKDVNIIGNDTGVKNIIMVTRLTKLMIQEQD